MKYLLNEQPITPDKLHGRLLYTSRYVDDADVRQKDVLDIGCGYAWFELYALSRDVRRITGVEPTAADLRAASQHIQDERVGLVIGSAIALPFPRQSFDTIACWEVLEHLPKSGVRHFFSEAKRVLRPGGSLYLSTPHHSLASTALDPARWLIGHRHYSQARVRSFADASGFRVASSNTAGGWWEILGWWNLYTAKWIFRRRPFFAEAMDSKIDGDFRSASGFTNVFCKMVAL